MFNNIESFRKEDARRKEIRRILLESAGLSCFKDYAESVMMQFSEECQTELEAAKRTMRSSQGVFDSWFIVSDETFRQVVAVLVRDGRIQESYDEDRRRRAVYTAIYSEFKSVKDPTKG